MPSSWEQDNDFASDGEVQNLEGGQSKQLDTENLAKKTVCGQKTQRETQSRASEPVERVLAERGDPTKKMPPTANTTLEEGADGSFVVRTG
jgi:hypothetical protein